MYFFYPSTTTHFFFSLSFFSFLSFALVDFGGWFLLGFFVLFCLGHFYKSWGAYCKEKSGVTLEERERDVLKISTCLRQSLGYTYFQNAPLTRHCPT
jgi:hypothetical protein